MSIWLDQAGHPCKHRAIHNELTAINFSYTTLIPVRSEGSQPPLIVAPQLSARNDLAQELATVLGPDHPVYSFDRLKHEDGTYVNDMDLTARIQAEELEAAGLSGPFFLTGYSFGAHLAFCLANRLLERGHRIGHLAIIDDNADVDRQWFNIESKSGNFSVPEVAGRFALDRLKRRKFPGKLSLYRADRWFGTRQSDTAGDWQYVAEGGVDVADFPTTHNAIISREFLVQWAEFLRSEITGIRSKSGFRHVPAQTHRGPGSTLTAFARAKHGDLDGEMRDYRRALEECPKLRTGSGSTCPRRRNRPGR